VPKDPHRLAARATLDQFDDRLRDAQAEATAAQNIAARRPSDFPAVDLTVGQLGQLLKLMAEGDEPIPPRARLLAAEKIHRLSDERGAALHYLQSTAPESLRHRLEALRERHRILSHDAHPAYAFDEATKIAETMRTELDRRAGLPPSFTERRPENDAQLRFDLAAAEAILARLPPAVVAQGRRAQRELDAVVAEIAKLEAAILQP
jgi:hypothetical protein